MLCSNLVEKYLTDPGKSCQLSRCCLKNIEASNFTWNTINASLRACMNRQNLKDENLK